MDYQNNNQVPVFVLYENENIDPILIRVKTSGDLNTNHLNTKLFEAWISNGLVFKWAMSMN